MKKCPKCGAVESKIDMTTSETPVEANAARCPCGWTGTVAELIDEKPAKPEKPEPASKSPETQVPGPAAAPAATAKPEKATAEK